MKTHIIPRKPEILDWSEIPSLAIDRLHWTPLVDITASAQLVLLQELLRDSLQMYRLLLSVLGVQLLHLP